MSGTVVLLVIVAAYALFARRLDRLLISGPMVFVAAGLALGPDGAALLELSLDSEVVLGLHGDHARRVAVRRCEHGADPSGRR